MYIFIKLWMSAMIYKHIWKNKNACITPLEMYNNYATSNMWCIKNPPLEYQSK